MAKTSTNGGRRRANIPTDDPNEIQRRQAHERIDQLFDEATRGKFYGEIGFSVIFEAGVAKRVCRRLEGTD